MKKRMITALLLIAVLVLTLAVPASAESKGSLNNFTKTQVYNGFTDVSSSAWYKDSVKGAYEYGLVQGYSATVFNPDGNLTIAESITLACRLADKYYGKGTTFTNGNPWYSTYVDYALSNGIISSGDYTDYNAKATRIQFAKILAAAFDDEGLESKNYIAKIPDVKEDTEAGKAVYKLYRAGILTGNDSEGTFSPASNIKRSEVAAIVLRMADTKERKSLTLANLNSYNEIIATVADGLKNGFGEFGAQGLDLSVLLNKNNRNIGYIKYDIDGDDIPELIIAEDEGNQLILIDVFTIVDYKPVSILTSSERNRYYLTKDNIICNEGSSAASSSIFAYYKLNHSKLELIEAVIYDSDKNSANPWFYSKTDLSSGTGITEAKAQTIIDKYQYNNMDITKFDPKTLTIKPNTSGINTAKLPDGEYQASFNTGSLTESGLTITIYEPQIYSFSDIIDMRVGDSVTVYDKTVTVKSVEYDGNDVIMNDEYTFILKDGSYQICAENDATSYSKVGTVTVPLSDSFKLSDNIELNNPKTITQNELGEYFGTLTDSSAEFSFISTTVKVSDGKIAKIERQWIP